MPFNANDFKQNLSGSGARPNLFDVLITFPKWVVNGTDAGLKMQYTAKTTSLPGGTIGMVSIPYMGRTLKYPGDRTFEDWTVTIINDEDFLCRKAMERWQSGLSQYHTDTSQLRYGAACKDYAADIVVRQYGKCDTDPIYEYVIKQAFPTAIAQIDVSWDTVDEIEVFDVTFAFDSVEPSGVEPEG